MIIVALAFIIGFLYLLWIRKKDHYEKEPFGKLTTAFLFGGTLSIIICTILYKFVHVEHTFADAFFKIGPIEELSKLLALAITYRFFEDDFNEPADGLVYMSAVALGFSTIENIFYSFSSSFPYGLLAIRSVVCVLGHISFSAYMGIAFYIHKQAKSNWDGLIISFIVASLAHGLYDGFLFDNYNGFFVLIFWIGLVTFLFIFMNMTLSLSPFKKRFHLDEFKKTKEISNIQCINCNSDVRSERLEFQEIQFSVCESCDYIVVRKDEVTKLFTYFRPGFRKRRFLKTLPSETERIALDDQEHIFYHPVSGIISAKHDSFEIWLHHFGKMGVQERIKTRLSGKIFKYIGANKLMQ